MRYKSAPDRLEKLQEAAFNRKEVKKRIEKNKRAEDKRLYSSRLREWKKDRSVAKPEMKTDEEFFKDHFEKKGYYHPMDPRYTIEQDPRIKNS